MNSFYETGKNQKKTQNFDTRFREHDQSVKMNAKDLFCFSKVWKSQKMNFPIDNTVHFYPCKTFKKDISLPKTF